MPSEYPRLPAETYQSLLSHGAARHLPIQAGEVVEYRNARPWVTLRGVGTVIVTVISLAILVGLWA